MQKYLLASFFNAQEHCIVHILHEIEMCGPIQTRTMFPIERYLKVLKKIVKQKAHPEGSKLQKYLFFKSTVYLTELCNELNIEGPQLWDSNQSEKFEGHVFIGRAKTREIKGG